MGWVSVKDRLPKDFERVWVCDVKGNICIMFHHQDYGAPFSIIKNNHFIVTHWMALPESSNKEQTELSDNKYFNKKLYEVIEDDFSKSKYAKNNKSKIYDHFNIPEEFRDREVEIRMDTFWDVYDRSLIWAGTKEELLEGAYCSFDGDEFDQAVFGEYEKDGYVAVIVGCGMPQIPELCIAYQIPEMWVLKSENRCNIDKGYETVCGWCSKLNKKCNRENSSSLYDCNSCLN